MEEEHTGDAAGQQRSSVGQSNSASTEHTAARSFSNRENVRQPKESGASLLSGGVQGLLRAQLSSHDASQLDQPVSSSFQSSFRQTTDDTKVSAVDNVASIPLPSQPRPAEVSQNTSEPSTMPCPTLPSATSQTSIMSSVAAEVEEFSHDFEETEAAVMSLLATDADSEGYKSVIVCESGNNVAGSQGFHGKEATRRKAPIEAESNVGATSSDAVVILAQPSEGLSSLVSYSSSSAEVSASEDNAQDDQENSSSDELLDSNDCSSQFIEAAKSGSCSTSEQVKEESPKGSPGDVLAAAAEALISSAESSQEEEDTEATQGVTRPSIEADSSVTLTANKSEMDTTEPCTVDIADIEEEDPGVKCSVSAEEGSAAESMLQAGAEKEEDLELVQESAVENSETIGEEEDQAEPLTALDEESQAAQEAKDQVDFRKVVFEDAENPLATDLHSKETPQHLEQEDFTFTTKTSDDEHLHLSEEIPQNLLEDPSPEDVASDLESTALVKQPSGELDANRVESEETNKGKGTKRALEEDTAVSPEESQEDVQEMPEKKAKTMEETAEFSPSPQEEREEQDTPPGEEESEPMELEATQELDLEKSLNAEKLIAVEEIEKGDEGSRDGEGDELAEDENEKKASIGQDKDKDDSKEEEESSSPSKRRKKKKKSYERPRGEGGKFMKEKPDPSMLDEETRMDYSMMQDEDSQGSASRREVRRFRCEVIVPESTEVFTADKVVEYVWPLEGIGEHYFIQEQISQYLGIMSFKRRYPDLRRRPIDMQERDYLKEKGLVSEMACDLGLTAVRSEDVLDVMFNDFPVKFEELQRLLRERKENEMRERGKVNYSMANIDKSKMQEYGRKAAADAARWNANFNKEKREDRRYSFDLQTFTLQMPIGRGKKLPAEYTKMGFYPVAVLPGQYTNHYREYTSQSLKTMPLGTVVAAPVVPDQLGSDGASSDSEDETQRHSRSMLDVSGIVKEEKGSEAGPRCKVCSGTKNRNKGGKPEPLIICGNCRSASHPTCIDLTLVMVPKIESYNWQCMDCKSCVTCNDPDDEDKMIFCDMCDRGYHIYCVGLRRVPNGRWHCKECAMCSSCGSKTPAGNEHLKNAEWQHEFKKDKDNKQLRYATTLCVPCDKYWKRRQFCYVCLKVYRSIPEDGMVRCSNCPKYIHREVCSTMYENERFCINCFKMRNSTALNHSRIIAAAKKKMASGY